MVAVLCVLAACIAVIGGLRAIQDERVCLDPSKSSSRQTSFDASPEICISPARRYTAVIETSVGTIRVALDARNNLALANNFVALARAKFYDGTVIHRAMKGTLIQGGDPSATGHGGPGYDFIDLENSSPLRTGDIGMATGIDSWSGSQFFIVTGQPDVLAPDARAGVFGKVVSGLQVATNIADAGSELGEIRPDGYATVRRVHILEL